MTKFTCVEATSDIDLIRLQVRLWLNRRTDDLLDLAGGFGLQWRTGVLVQEYHVQHPKATMQQWLEFLARLPDVNAAQVRYAAKDGISIGAVVYTVEFDGHG